MHEIFLQWNPNQKECSEFCQIRSRADREARVPLRSDRMVMDRTQIEPDQDKITGAADKIPQLHRRSNKMEVECDVQLDWYK